MTSCTDFSPVRKRPQGMDAEEGLESLDPGALSITQIALRVGRQDPCTLGQVHGPDYPRRTVPVLGR